MLSNKKSCRVCEPYRLIAIRFIAFTAARASRIMMPSLKRHFPQSFGCHNCFLSRRAGTSSKLWSSLHPLRLR